VFVIGENEEWDIGVGGCGVSVGTVNLVVTVAMVWGGRVCM
jgi:hypothetical protein